MNKMPWYGGNLLSLDLELKPIRGNLTGTLNKRLECCGYLQSL